MLLFAGDRNRQLRCWNSHRCGAYLHAGIGHNIGSQAAVSVQSPSNK